MPTTNGHGSSGATERVALYLRVSSEEQRDRETIELQREFLEQYCRLYGLEVAEYMRTTVYPAPSPYTRDRRVSDSWKMPNRRSSGRCLSPSWTGWGEPCSSS